MICCRCGVSGALDALCALYGDDGCYGDGGGACESLKRLC